MSSKQSIQEFEVIFSKDSLTEFLRKLQDVAKINTVVKIYFNTDRLMFYTFAPRSMTVCKACFMPPTAAVKTVPKEFEKGLQMMIGDTKKFVKKMAFYRDSTEIKVQIGYRVTNTGQYHIVWMKPKDKKLKMTLTMQELHLLPNVTKDQIVQKSNQDPNFNFDVDVQTLVDVKKLTQLNPETEAMSLRIDNKRLCFEEEGKWDMEIMDTIDYENVHFNFQKKYFNSLDNKDKTNIKVFDDFLMVSTEDMFLMIGLEVNDF
jgi:hypothetical protein